MLSDAAVQSRLTLGVASAAAVSEPGVPGFTLSMTCTFTPLASDESVLNEMPDTGSVKVCGGGSVVRPSCTICWAINLS